MSNDEKMLRCHCGGDPHLHKTKRNGTWKYWYECGLCWNCTNKYADEKQAREKWNSAEQEYKEEREELKPCPFCGGEAEMSVSKHIPDGRDYTPRCKNTSCCGRLTKKYTVKETAIYMWNRRAE